MVTNVKGLINSFLILAVLCGSVSNAKADIKDLFREKNPSPKMSSSIKRTTEKNSKQYFEGVHKQEKKDQKAAHKKAIKDILNTLQNNAKNDLKKILNISYQKLRIDSIINICGEFKLIEKKLNLLNKMQNLLTEDTLKELKNELLNELKDAYLAAFSEDNDSDAVFKQYGKACKIINDKFSQIENISIEKPLANALSITQELNLYINDYINDLVYQYEEANYDTLNELLKRRRKEGVRGYNKQKYDGIGKTYEKDIVKVSNDDINNLIEEHVNVVRKNKI